VLASEYCQRIGLKSLPAGTPEGLAAIQHAQRQAIPFENLDICLCREICVDPDAVFGKLVMARRGGYCFEQNMLLASALTAMDVSNRPVLARVWLGATETPPLTHLALVAEVEGDNWLMDAGFGSGYCPPLRLNDGVHTKTSEGSVYRLTQDDILGWVLDQMIGGAFVRQYSFNSAKAVPADIRLSNHWTSTHPASRFKQNLIVNRITEDGRISLMNSAFTRTGDNEQSLNVVSPAQLGAILEGEFGFDFSDIEIAALARQIGI
jgi:N-hydroxyarylamine O-acetyltransferase